MTYPRNEPILPDDSLLYCSAVWHLIRLKGKGSALAFPLYDRACALASKSGRFHLSLTRLAPYFNVDRRALYSAADLLRQSGFFIETDYGCGEPSHYHPVTHEEWAEKHPGKCCEKLVMPWDGEDGDPLGRQLYGITGLTFYPQILKGWRNKSGLTDEQIVERTKIFMEDRATLVGLHNGIAKRRALGRFLCGG